MFQTIQDVKKDLGYTDSRSVYKWLRNSAVKVLCDPGRNRRYVISREYEAARHREAIKYVSAKYGSGKLPEVLPSAMHLSAQFQSAVTQRNTKSQPTHNEYSPAGNLEKTYLTNLLNG